MDISTIYYEYIYNIVDIPTMLWIYLQYQKKLKKQNNCMSHNSKNHINSLILYILIMSFFVIQNQGDCCNGFYNPVAGRVTTVQGPQQLITDRYGNPIAIAQRNYHIVENNVPQIPHNFCRNCRCNFCNNCGHCHGCSLATRCNCCNPRSNNVPNNVPHNPPNNYGNQTNQRPHVNISNNSQGINVSVNIPHNQPTQYQPTQSPAQVMNSAMGLRDAGHHNGAGNVSNSSNGYYQGYRITGYQNGNLRVDL
jgi:hypothetical protein